MIYENFQTLEPHVEFIYIIHTAYKIMALCPFWNVIAVGRLKATHRN
jgi:hypothetical protein